MDIIDRHREPSQRELQLFGLIPAVVLGIIGAVLGRIVGWPFAIALWTIGVLFALVYYAVPAARWLLYRAWMTGTFPLGWIVSHALLGVVYYAVLTPLGVALRLIGRDPMGRGFEPGAPSYWARRPVSNDVRRYFRQY